MKRDGAAGRWSGFWAQVRRDYASLWPEMRDSWRDMREQGRETTAEVRQARQFDRRIRQRITGLQNPTRQQFRRAARQIDAEVDELKAIERRVLREHRAGGDDPPSAGL